MSKILRRPMFRGGQVESKDDLKVIDQMGIAKLAQGGRVGYAAGDVVDIYESMSEKIPMPEKRKRRPLSTGDYLRIASAGLDILGAPSEGSGIGGALRTAAGPLSKLGVGLAGSMDARTAADEETYQKLVDARNDKILGLTGVQSEYDIGMAKVNKKTATEINLDVVDLYYNNKIQEERAKEGGGDTIVIDQFIKDRDYSKLDIAQGGNKASKFRILSPANVELALELAREKLGEEATLEQIKLTASEFLLGLVMDFDKGLSGMATRVNKAEGGMMTEDVNMMTETPQGITDVNVSETETIPEQTNEINISYDQLRDRLPPEVTDDIVLLMSQSYEALADFAEIQTQADVNQFNTKYNVQLFLPQQSGA